MPTEWTLKFIASRKDNTLTLRLHTTHPPLSSGTRFLDFTALLAVTPTEKSVSPKSRAYSIMIPDTIRLVSHHWALAIHLMV